jgi:hypothetical protein
VLNKVEVVTETGKTLELPIVDPPEGYVVKDIQGLDPVKANLVSASFANMEGEQYHASRREKRNLVFTLGLEPDPVFGTARTLRKKLYDHLMPKSNVLIRFHDDDLGVVEIWGRVETLECPLFVQEPEATISILCFNPDFYEPEVIVFNGLSTQGSVEAVINYTGTIETGIKFSLTADRLIDSGLVIYHRAPDNTMRTLDFTKPLGTGARLDISTISGAKGATLTTESTGTDSILYGITPESNWINLYPGENYIRVHVDEYQALIPFTIEYTNKHGGL